VAGSPAAIELPAGSGTYLLILSSGTRRRVEIGRRGPLKLEPGFYVYVGSAFGSGGLRARIAHHERRSAKPHWHIDYLRRALKLDTVWYATGTQYREHLWAEAAGNMDGAAIPLRRFGASDCRCPSHLFHVSKPPRLDDFKVSLRVLDSHREQLHVLSVAARGSE